MLAVGNRAPTTAVYDAANRLLDDGTFTYTYDNNGNRLTQTDQTTQATTTYDYDTDNQLTGITFPDGSQATYAYDALGRRIQKTVDGQITRYVYDNEDILQEDDATNILRARWTHGPGIDEPLILERDLDLDGTLEARLFYHTDGLGSSVALTNSTGAVVERYRYTTFGQPTILGPGPDGLMDTPDDVTLSCSAYGNPYLFTGREYDCESGLYYYRARYYDPKTGTFVQEDPVTPASMQLPLETLPTHFPKMPLQDYLSLSPLQLNLYAYAMNNPLNRIDPTGMASCAAESQFDMSKFADCILRVQNRAGSGPGAILGFATTCLAAIKLPAPAAVKIPLIAVTCSLPVLIVANCIKEAREP